MSLYLRVSLIYGIHLFSGKCIRGILVYAILTPLTICDEAISLVEGIILVFMSRALWFARVGIKLYKRHLCQKDGQCWRKLLKIQDNASCEYGYNVRCHLCKFYPSVFLLHIHLEYDMRLYNYLRHNTFMNIKYISIVFCNGVVIHFIILWTQKYNTE